VAERWGGKKRDGKEGGRGLFRDKAELLIDFLKGIEKGGGGERGIGESMVRVLQVGIYRGRGEKGKRKCDMSLLLLSFLFLLVSWLTCRGEGE